jgi:FixJ family two-component response regulator
LTSIPKKIVAIVDDDPGMRRALRTVLSAFGYAVYTFDSADSFLSTAATSKAGCLVVDVQLGDSSGIELGRQLAAAGFSFPMIFMTSLENELIRKQATQLGCVAYLQKPFSSDVLIEAIVRGTERSCWRS